MIVVREDQKGNLSLAIDSGVRSLNQDQMSALCVKAIHEYFIVDGFM